MNALSTRPRNLCFAISVTGLIMFVIGCLVAKNGNCSVMGIGSAASLMVVLFGLVGAGRCAFARRQKMEEEAAAAAAVAAGLGLEAGSKEEAGIIRMLEFGSHLDLERMQATLPLDNISYRRESAI